MILNLASAGLVWADYQRNQTHVYVNQAEYGLSIAEIVFIGLMWYGFALRLTKQSNKDDETAPSLLFFVVQVFNIAFSAYMIEYYESQAVLPFRIIQIALAIIILNCIFMCSCSCYYSRSG